MASQKDPIKSAQKPNSKALDDEEIKLDDSDELAINEDIFDDLDEQAEAIDESVEEVKPEAPEPAEDKAEKDTEKTEKTAEELPADPAADDPVIEKAIEDIVAHEGDTVLAVEDRTREYNNSKTEAKKPEGKIGRFLKTLWSNPKSRWAIIALTTAAALMLALVPSTRYFILNTARVRASIELKVVDSSTLQPLKNVSVRAAGSEAKTDGEGSVKLTSVPLGKTKLQIEKRAFAPQDKDITVGWGSNPLGEFRVAAVGTQYTFYVKDSLSTKPIVKAEAVSGEGSAVSDDEGKVVLVLDTAEQDDSSRITVDILAESYRKETLNIAVNNKEAQSVDMVPSKRHAFVSKRSGKYDVYTVDVDGKNETRALEGSGFERDDIALVPHPAKNTIAYVATRENTRNPSGYLLSTLYIIDADRGSTVKIDQSEQIQIVGWSEQGRLIYVKIASGASGTDPERHRLISFNGDDLADTKELASSNSFNDVVMADDIIYYAPSNIFQEDNPAMYSIRADGSDKKVILDKEVFSIVRSGHDNFYLSAGNDWYAYTLGSPQAASSSPPGSQNSRIYVDNPKGKFSLWVDNRDGKGVLVNYDGTTRQESTLVERGGLKQPVTWLNEKYLIYRVADGRETADYIMNIEGGNPRKVIDVTDTAGISKWYYF